MFRRVLFRSHGLDHGDAGIDGDDAGQQPSADPCGGDHKQVVPRPGGGHEQAGGGCHAHPYLPAGPGDHAAGDGGGHGAAGVLTNLGLKRASGDVDGALGRGGQKQVTGPIGPLFNGEIIGG